MFLWYELPHHQELCHRITIAKRYFYTQNYKTAIELYEDIVKQYPNFTEGKMQIVRSYFALSVDDEVSYIKGLLSLPEKSYKDSELVSLAKFLPDHHFKHFMSQFERA